MHRTPTLPRPARLLAVVLSALLLAVILAGCGGGDDDDAGTEPARTVPAPDCAAHPMRCR